jgi:hypothetical protein
MGIEINQLEEVQLNLAATKEAERQRCLFYRDQVCNPYKATFKICSKCHRCKVVTVENVIPRLFDKIVGLAIFLAGTLGMGLGSAGTAGGSGGGSGSGGSGK